MKNKDVEVVSISNILIENHTVIIFKFKSGNINNYNFKEFLAVLEKIIDIKKPFSFIADASESSIKLKEGMIIGKNLISWMKKNKPKIPGLILCSSIVLSKNYPKIGEILNWVFQQQKPVSPNLITTDDKLANEFITSELKKLN